MHFHRRLAGIAGVLALTLTGSLMMAWPALARQVVPPPVPTALQVPAGNIPFYRASAPARLVNANGQPGQVFTASARQRVTRDAVVAAATAPTCQNIQLLIRPFKGNAAAGHAGEEYIIRNISHGSCTLRGFPGLLLLDSRFVTLPTSLTWSSNLLGHHPVQTVPLGPGGIAYFALNWPTIPTGGQGCPTAPYLMITPPNDRLPVVTFSTVGSGIHPCGGHITATPVVPSLLF